MGKLKEIWDDIFFIPPGRVNWIDCVKGLTIVLVVAHHVLEGLKSNPGLSEKFLYWYDVLSPVRMPLFFLVAGFFASRALSAPLRSFLDGKIVHFLYFYILWSVLSGLLRVSMNSVANNQTDPTEILALFWDPLPTLWFLYALAIAFGVSRLLRKAPPAYWVAAAAILQGAALQYDLFPQAPIVEKVLYLYVYFVIGMHASEWIRNTASKTTYLKTVIALAAFVAVGVIARQRDLIFEPVVYFSMSALSAYGLIGLCVLGCRDKYMLPFVIIGKRSFEIYLTHFLPAAGARIILMRLGVDDPLIIAPLGVIGCIGFAFVAFYLLRGTLLGFVFDRPRFMRLRPEQPQPQSA